MIISSGQILTGKAAVDLPSVIVNRQRADGFHETVHKALALPATMPTTASSVNGTWVTIAQAGDEDRFLGIAGDDTSPEANINLTSQQPVLGLWQDYNVKQGGVIPFERNGVITVFADGAISEGDFLVLGANGAFKKQTTPDRSTALGRAYESAADGQAFIAYISAL